MFKARKHSKIFKKGDLINQLQKDFEMFWKK